MVQKTLFIFCGLEVSHCGLSGSPEKADAGLGRSNYFSQKTKANERSLCVCSLEKFDKIVCLVCVI